MRKLGLSLLAFAVASIIGAADVSYAARRLAPPQKAAGVMKTDELKSTLRDLWVGHIFWVRNVALTTRYGDGEGAKVAEEKAVQNAKDIAASIAPFYGKAASDKLFTLLAGHYGAVKEYMAASYGNDKRGKEKATASLLKNADEIASFLSGANPYLPKETLVSLLTAHGGHHMAQLDALADKNLAAEAPVWDAMKNHIYVISDALATGLAKQFPKQTR